jgi:glutathione S-transferase
MATTALVIASAMIEYIVFAMLVGAARGRYGVAAPATSGHPMFDRYFRVQQNTLELLVPFVVGMALFGFYVSGWGAAALGSVYLVGRAWYAMSYVRDPERRGAGFGMSMLPIVILLAGSLYGVGRELLR